MATGDRADMVSRMRAVFPTGWFPRPASSGAGTTPILDALLSGAAACGAWLYDLIQVTVAQARLATASGPFLDGVAGDFFGTNLPRLSGEGDDAFRARIKATLLLPLGTRAGIVDALTILTGRAPVLLEPWNTGDTGGYNLARGYDVAGAYGSLALPAQVFVTAYRPTGSGIAQVAGYYGQGNATGPGGYNLGAIEYGAQADVAGQVTDAAIFATVDRARAAGVTAWVRISD